MTAAPSDEPDDAADAPRFEHGESLLIVSRPDGTVEFRTDAYGESIVADHAVDLRERR